MTLSKMIYLVMASDSREAVQIVVVVLVVAATKVNVKKSNFCAGHGHNSNVFMMYTADLVRILKAFI